MFEIKNLTEEKVFIFILCYTYNLNLLHVMKLYDLSDSLFKSYLKAFQPMLKLTANRMITLRMQATRVYNIIKGHVPNKVKEADMQVAKILGRHLGRGYADNNRFLTIEDLKDREIFILEKDNSKTPITYDMFVRVFNNIPNIMIGENVYHRTTPVGFLLCKYFDDRNAREILNMHLIDLHKMLEEAMSGEANG